jgi:DNA repair photolyase
MARIIQTKTILSKLNKGPDPWFGIAYNMNLYRGCQHQCIYCDSRSECYQLGNLADIRIKEGALNILEKELKSKRLKATIGFGSMNDPYMPIEKKEELVRGALKLLIKYRFPAHIITKSNLVVRDTDLLENLSSAVYAAVSFTITTPSDELSRIIEPAAPTSLERLLAMKTLSDAGIYTGVTLMPILPFINDSWDEIKELIVLSKENGAKYIVFWPGLTLRSGSREYFYSKIEQYFPGTKEKYIKTYGENYTCNALNAKQLYTNAENLCAELNIPMKMEHYDPPKEIQTKLNF